MYHYKHQWIIIIIFLFLFLKLYGASYTTVYELWKLLYLQTRTIFVNSQLYTWLTIYLWVIINILWEISKTEFYQELEQIYDSKPRNYTKMAKKEYIGTIGKNLHDKSNENGNILIDFATSKKMVNTSIYFPRQDIRKQCLYLQIEKQETR